MASRSASCNSKDEFFMNAGGSGVLFRAQADVLYLDKSCFWKQYFVGCRESDVLIPGVYSANLRKVQNIAVDIALLRNTSELEAIVRSIIRHMPNVKNFSAMITSTKSRPAVVPRTVVAILERNTEKQANEEIEGLDRSPR
ncbi:hypothetical protein VM1G_03771 [Cytospora mali]|uniref:Uncharacterized protein n=1 Tax=Cytospora mali TaxID=578113 RepID=A0A194VWD3_CYTMA|nr:hypothetical protein VM1G_03771 [Valsa mali]